MPNDAHTTGRSSRGRVLLGLGVAGTLVTGSVIAATWNTFPGAWVKNRAGLSTHTIERAAQRAESTLALRDRQPPLTEPLVWIRKGERRLVLLDGDVEILRTRVGLGFAPEGHKQRQGDGRTPEGDYRICTRNDRSRFHLFLGIDYPAARDAERGLSDGLISRRQHDSIALAWQSRRRPPWDTPLGGTVGIHGSGASWDWTLGCVALDDPDIEVLWALCPLGTPVRIDP